MTTKETKAKTRTAVKESPMSKKSKVAVVHATPETVFDDIARAMHLADYQDILPKDVATLLKINISWQHYYPACSSSPWQIEGVIKAMQADGYKELVSAHNGTVVVDSFEGEVRNKQKVVTDKYKLQNVHLDVPPTSGYPMSPRAR